MVNYNNGKIYKIICDETNKTYYGSTTQPLCKRFQKHKNIKSTVFNEMTNPKIYLVEDYSCERKEQLLKRERYFIENNDCINKDIPGRTKEEFGKVYYISNRDKIVTNRNQKITCECGSIHNKGNLSKHIKTKKHIKYVNSI